MSAFERGLGDVRPEAYCSVYFYDHDDLEGQGSALRCRSIHQYYFPPPPRLVPSYAMGDMLGAGSFGVVRQATENQTGNQYAVKSIMKIPKNGRPTPRYLIKLQTEVDAMRQLGASLDAVHLKVGGEQGCKGVLGVV